MTHLPALEEAIDDETFAFGSFIGSGWKDYTFAHATPSPRIIWREVIVNAVLWLLLPVYMFIGVWWLLRVRDAWRDSRRSKAVVEQKCSRCGYDLRYIIGTTCPECGDPQLSPDSD